MDGGGAAPLDDAQLRGLQLDVPQLSGVEVGDGASDGACGVAGEVAEERGGGDRGQQEEGTLAGLGVGEQGDEGEGGEGGEADGAGTACVDSCADLLVDSGVGVPGAAAGAVGAAGGAAGMVTCWTKGLSRLALG